MVPLQAGAAAVSEAAAVPYAACDSCVATTKGEPERKEEEVMVVGCSYAVGSEGAVVVNAQNTPAGQHVHMQLGVKYDHASSSSS
jgi:hypothetical protein